MRSRLLICILLVSLGSSMIGLILLHTGDSSVTLQEISTRGERDVRAAFKLADLGRAVQDGAQRSFDFDMESLFYGLLALCGVLLSLRTLIYAARVYRSERGSKARQSAGYGASRERDLSLSPAPPSAPTGALAEPVAPKPTRALTRPSIGVWPQIVACGHGLTGKMILAFTTVIAVFGMLTVTTVYIALTSSLRRQAIEQARVTAVNVSDSAAGFVLKKNLTALGDLVRKFADRKGLAYVLVENPAGEILAHSFAALSEDAKGRAGRRAPFSMTPRRLQTGQSEIYEVEAPILEGRIGAVRVGIWRDTVDEEIFRTVMPLIKIITLVIVGGILLAVVLAWQINRPIVKLVNAARSISRGELDAPSPGLEDTTEFGELSRALERMRSSVKAAMTRLSQER